MLMALLSLVNGVGTIIGFVWVLVSKRAPGKKNNDTKRGKKKNGEIEIDIPNEKLKELHFNRNSNSAMDGLIKNNARVPYRSRDKFSVVNNKNQASSMMLEQMEKTGKFEGKVSPEDSLFMSF